MGPLTTPAKRAAALFVTLGGGLVVAGVALIYPPAAVIVAGVGLVAIGLEELRSRT